MKKLMVCSVVCLLAMSFALAADNTASVGNAAPAISLPDANGKTHSLADYSGKIVVLEWINPECPFVVRHYNLKTMTALAEKNKDVVWLAVATGGTADAAKLKAFAEKNNVSYPILLDADGAVGKAYGAKTTPHMYIIDKSGKLVFAGGIDNDANGDPAAPLKDGTVNYVEKGLGELQSGQSVSKSEAKPYGCSVKYSK